LASDQHRVNADAIGSAWPAVSFLLCASGDISILRRQTQGAVS
jgi:hypothetical protein